MKDYKKLAPILIVFFTFIAIYSRISEASDKETEYYGYLEAARNYREGKIYVDAIVEYENALNMRNTIELCKEIGDMYLEKGDSSDIDYWADYLTETYPLEAYSYEYLMDYYMSLEKYDKCFELYDEVVARGITSDEIESEILGIRYEYTLGYKSYDYVSEFSNDKCVVYDLAKGLYGYQSTTDNKVINPRYVQAGAFNNIMAPIQDAEGEFYFVDSEGNRKLNVPKDIEITKVGYIQNDRYPVGTEGTMYFADMDGNLILGPYEDATACNGGISAVKENGYWYMIDMDGNKLSEAMLGFATDVKGMIYRNDVVFGLTEQGYVMLDSNGAKVTKDVYEDVRCFTDSTYAAVKLNGKWGFIDNTGKVVIEPQYEDAKSFSNGYAAVCVDGLWGYITSDTTMAIQPAFYGANGMSSKGTAFVETEANKWVLLTLVRKDL